MTEPLSYTTSIMSWNFMHSSFGRAKSSVIESENIDLNLETPSSIILCAIAIEAFCNELSSISCSFYSDCRKKSNFIIDEHDKKILSQLCDYRQIKKGSFYDRYKRVMKILDRKSPKFLEELVHLRDLRDALVHFRKCDISVIEGNDGVIRYAQELPEVFDSLKTTKVSGQEVIDANNDSDWTLRISTSAMAVWVLNLTCLAVLHLLDSLPGGSYKEFVLQAYRPADSSFRDLFSKAKNDIADWENYLFK